MGPDSSSLIDMPLLRYQVAIRIHSILQVLNISACALVYYFHCCYAINACCTGSACKHSVYTSSYALLASYSNRTSWYIKTYYEWSVSEII